MTWRVNFVRSKDAQKQLARTSLNAAHAQLLEELRPIAFAETCRSLAIQSLDFQEIWQNNSETT